MRLDENDTTFHWFGIFRNLLMFLSFFGEFRFSKKIDAKLKKIDGKPSGQPVLVLSSEKKTSEILLPETEKLVERGLSHPIPLKLISHVGENTEWRNSFKTPAFCWLSMQVLSNQASSTGKVGDLFKDVKCFKTALMFLVLISAS